MNPEQLANEYVSITETPELAARIKKAWLNGYYESQKERTKLVTQLDICRLSLASCVKENEALESLQSLLKEAEKENKALKIFKDDALRTLHEDGLMVDRLRNEIETLKIDYAIYEACEIEMNRLYKENEKLMTFRSDDQFLINKLQTMLDEAQQIIKELRLKLSEWIVED